MNEIARVLAAVPEADALPPEGPKAEQKDAVSEDIESDPSAFLPFETHARAVAVLQNIGYAQADTAPSFSSTQLAAAMQEVLSSEGMTVLDLTSTVPETPHAAYQALTVGAFNASVSSRKDEKVVFLIMRTLENTPSFLFGHHWGHVQAFGKEAATRPTRTPTVFLFYKQKQIEIPAEVCSLDYELAARLAAAEVAENHEYFCCGICGSALAERTKSGLHLKEMAVTNCNVTFLKECLIGRINSGQFDCPVTGNSLCA